MTEEEKVALAKRFVELYIGGCSKHSFLLQSLNVSRNQRVIIKCATRFPSHVKMEPSEVSIP